MPTRRYLPGIAALDNRIYVTGGHHCGLSMSHVDCYDPDTNTWSQMAKMNIARHGHILVSLHGRLYAIGGYLGGPDLQGCDVDSVEVYDPGSNTWTLLQHKLDDRVYNTGAGLIKKYYLRS